MTEIDQRKDMAALLAQIHREFRQGLPDRLGRIRGSLERLSAGYDRAAADLFYRTAHSLKGTAPSFGADGLVEPAAALSAIGRRWLEGGAVPADEIPGAREQFERLGTAVREFIDAAERRSEGEA